MQLQQDDQPSQTDTDRLLPGSLNAATALFFRHDASAGQIAILMMQPLLNTDDAGKTQAYSNQEQNIPRPLDSRLDTPFKFR